MAGLQDRGHIVDVAWTERAGDASRLAAACARDVDCVIAAGGDGTFREVFAGVGDRASILPVPLGTGNMMARELGIPHDPAALIALIESGAERRIDVGRVGDTPFLAVASVGFDAMVTRVIATERRGALGYRGYLLPILRAAIRYRAPRLQVWLDDAEPIGCGFVIVTKVVRYGGIMRLSERARLDSGEFEVCLASPANAAHLMLLGPMALTGMLRHAPGLEMRPARRVRVDVERPVAGDGVPVDVEVDGDHFGVTPIDVTIEEGAARVVAPPPRLLAH